eukprot:s1_g1910.t1
MVPIIVLDASEGIGDVDRHFARLVAFLGLPAPIVFVSNLSLIGYDREQFELVEEEYLEILSKARLEPAGVFPLPLNGCNLMPWWPGEGSSRVTSRFARGAPSHPSPLRLAVTLSENDGHTWSVEGRLLSGTVTAGDEILSSPSNLHGRVQTLTEGDPGSWTLTFNRPYYIEPGEVISHVGGAPVETDVFRVKAYWLGGVRKAGDRIRVETAYGVADGRLQSVEQSFVGDTYAVGSNQSVEIGNLVDLVVRTDRVIAVDHVEGHFDCAGVALFDADGEAEQLAVGQISMEGYADQRHLVTSKALNTTPVQFAVGEDARTARNGHEGGVLWFTGLSGSGKSTLAVALEARLFEKGYQVFVLDGDNVRQGLTSNLGFSPDDRSENIRRVGEVAALFRQAGVIVISSFISPYRSDRDRARHAAYSSFHEVYIKADIETCIGRDPKGLYERAIKGEIPDFTGISAPYEAPEKQMGVLVTGGAGYIGSHMVLALADAGEQVTVLDNLTTGLRSAVDTRAEFVEGDIGDTELVRKIIKQHNVAEVVHFAGSIVVPESVSDPLKYYENNTAKTRNLIDCCVLENVSRFVFSSTAAVYGSPERIPVTEDVQLAPMSPYGRSKLMSEWMLQDTSVAHDLNFVALRYFNVAGADPSGRSGQSTKNATHLIKVAVQAALGVRDHMNIFGDDYATPDGSCIRDYIHVSDLISAHEAALQYLRTGGTSLIANCGYGHGSSVKQVIEAVERVAGKPIDARMSARRAGDPAEIVADANLAREILGWSPRHDDLDEIVAHAYQWESKLIETAE